MNKKRREEEKKHTERIDGTQRMGMNVNILLDRFVYDCVHDHNKQRKTTITPI